MVLKLVNFRADIKSTFAKHPDLYEAFGPKDNKLQENYLGSTCHAVVVSHAKEFAIQIYNELKDLTMGTGINVLLCYRAEGNSVFGNLTDIRAGFGHIVIATIGRAKTMGFKEVTGHKLGPLLYRTLRHGSSEEKKNVLNELPFVNLFCSVKHLVIEECNFFFAPDKEDDLIALRKLTHHFAPEWKLQAVRAADPLLFAGLPTTADAEYDPEKCKGATDFYEGLSITKMEDWFKRPATDALRVDHYQLQTLHKDDWKLPTIGVHFPDRFIDSNTGAAFLNELCVQIEAKIMTEKSPDGESLVIAQTAIVMQHRKSVEGLQMYLNNSNKLRELGASALILTGDMPTEERVFNSNWFQENGSECHNAYRVLITTAAIARGLNLQAKRVIIPELPKVDEDGSGGRPFEELLGLIARGDRHNACDVVLFLGRNGSRMAHQFRGYLSTLADHTDYLASIVEEIKKEFPMKVAKGSNWKVDSGEDEDDKSDEGSGEDSARKGVVEV